MRKILRYCLINDASYPYRERKHNIQFNGDKKKEKNFSLASF
jgi:hypothetical protein